MENSIYIGLSRQVALRDSMDTIANNIANLSTPGYRAQNMVFEEYLTKERDDYDPMSFVNDRGQYMTTTPGSVSVTGNSLDVSIAGPGYFGVQGPNGVAYTRAGNFQMDANGTLRTASGDRVASAGGGDIVIPAGSTEVHIDETGIVSNQNGQLGQLMIAEFDNQNSLNPIGNNLYETPDAPLPPTNSRVKQGTLEGSNVQPVLEMTRMIDTLRSFQSLQNILQQENDRMKSVIQKLTSTS